MASFKHVNYIRELNPEAEIKLFYIDRRAPGRNEDFLQNIEKDDKLKMIKGKVAKIEEDPGSKDLTVEAEDIFSGNKYREKVDMVVLATGMQPSMVDEKMPMNIKKDKYGFLNYGSPDGIFFAGCSKSPTDVSTCIKDANGVALKAMQCIGRK